MLSNSVADIYQELKRGYYGSNKHTFDSEHYFFRWYRPISFLPSALLIKLGVTANIVTSFGALSLLSAFATLASGHLALGAFLYLIAYIVDFIDGNIARYSNNPTSFGKIFDGAVDLLTFLLFVSVGFGNVAAGESNFSSNIDIFSGISGGFVFLLRCYFSLRLSSALSSTLIHNNQASQDKSLKNNSVFWLLKLGKRISQGLISGMPIFLLIAVFTHKVSIYIISYLVLLSFVTVSEFLYGMRLIWLKDKAYI